MLCCVATLELSVGWLRYCLVPVGGGFVLTVSDGLHAALHKQARGRDEWSQRRVGRGERLRGRRRRCAAPRRRCHSDAWTRHSSSSTEWTAQLSAAQCRSDARTASSDTTQQQSAGLVSDEPLLLLMLSAFYKWKRSVTVESLHFVSAGTATGTCISYHSHYTALLHTLTALHHSTTHIATAA